MTAGAAMPAPVDIPLPTAVKNFGAPKKDENIIESIVWFRSRDPLAVEFDAVGSGLAVEFGKAVGCLSC